MFRVEVFCDDKKLAYVLHAMAGHILGEPKIHPVANAVKKGKSVVAASAGTSLLEMFINWLQRGKIREFVANDVRRFLSEIGHAGNASSYLLTQAKVARLIKRKPGTKGSNSRWLVVK